MRSTVGVLFVAVGVLLGVHGLARWQARVNVAAVEAPAAAMFAPAEASEPSAAADVAALPSPVARPPATAFGAVALERVSARVALDPAATPHELVRELQRGLRRAHCYAGPITGGWTAATRRAMQAFLARANAALPVDKPDIVLLALLRNEQDAVCGSCPAGQQPALGGSCLPAAMITESALHAGAPPRPARAAAVAAPLREPAARAPVPREAAAPAPPASIAGQVSIVDPTVATAETPVLAAVAPSAPPSARRVRERRVLHRRAHRVAVAYRHRLRPTRFAYRPVRYGGLVGLLFGGWRF